jgi:hypothetical protein
MRHCENGRCRRIGASQAVTALTDTPRIFMPVLQNMQRARGKRLTKLSGQYREVEQNGVCFR